MPSERRSLTPNAGIVSPSARAAAGTNASRTASTAHAVVTRRRPGTCNNRSTSLWARLRSVALGGRSARGAVEARWTGRRGGRAARHDRGMTSPLALLEQAFPDDPVRDMALSDALLRAVASG